MAIPRTEYLCMVEDIAMHRHAIMHEGTTHQHAAQLHALPILHVSKLHDHVFKAPLRVICQGFLRASQQCKLALMGWYAGGGLLWPACSCKAHSSPCKYSGILPDTAGTGLAQLSSVMCQESEQNERAPRA